MHDARPVLTHLFVLYPIRLINWNVPKWELCKATDWCSSLTEGVACEAYEVKSVRESCIKMVAEHWVFTERRQSVLLGQQARDVPGFYEKVVCNIDKRGLRCFAETNCGSSAELSTRGAPARRRLSRGIYVHTDGTLHYPGETSISNVEWNLLPSAPGTASFRGSRDVHIEFSR